GLEDEPEEDALVRGLEAAGVPDAAAEHQVGVSLGEELDTPDRLVARLDAGTRVAGQQVGGVGLGHEIERLEDAPADAASVRREVAFGVRSLSQWEGGVAQHVSAKAAVDREAQLPRRAEALLGHELRPVEEARVGAGFGGSGSEALTDLQAHGEAEPVLDLRDAPLGVRGNEADALELELLRPPLARVERLRLRIPEGAAVHEVDREIEADDDLVGDAVVELQRALERIVYELAVPVDERRAEERVAVVEDQTEADVLRAEDVRSVDGEEPLRVHRGSEKVGIDAIAVRRRNGVRCALPICRALGAEGQAAQDPDGRPEGQHPGRSTIHHSGLRSRHSLRARLRPHAFAATLPQV